MSKTSKIILVTIVATLILLGLGYAAIQNITLNIAGTASATADSGNFKVRFVGTPVVSDGSTTTAKITTDHEATIEVDGLTSAGQYVTATYEIKNESSDLSSDLRVTTSNSNTDYFKISSQLAKSSLTANESTTVLVTVELTKTPIDADVSATVGVELTAMPVQPGEEGTSAGTNDYSETPTEVNEYGFYFDEAYIYIDETGDRQIVIFHEDRSVEGYYNDVLEAYGPAGTATYTKETISGTGMTAEIMNSRQLYYNNATYTLDESFMDSFDSLTMNEYGFYFGQPYSVNVYGESQSLATLIFNENGSMEIYSDGKIEKTIPKGSLVYEKNKITVSIEETYVENGETKTETYTEIINIECNGRVIENDGIYLGLDPTFLEKYCLPEGYFYLAVIDELENGELVGEWRRQVPSSYRFFDTYITDEYAYSYANEQWAVALPSEIGDDAPSGYVPVGRDKESYGAIPETVFGYPVYSMINLYEGCTNLKTSPTIPSTIEHMNYAFKGCTSLETAPVIPSSVTSLEGTFEGCTSLSGTIIINATNLDEYADCFKGVDMTNIRLTGTVPTELLNAIGATGENYTPIK